MLYIPSPINLVYDIAYRAQANDSGRMQYYKILPGKSRRRISRANFIEAYNSCTILGIKPLKSSASGGFFEIEFYTAIKSKNN